MLIWLCSACARKTGRASAENRTKATPVSSHEDSKPKTFTSDNAYT
jgi:hypothetical protein